MGSIPAKINKRTCSHTLHYPSSETTSALLTSILQMKWSRPRDWMYGCLYGFLTFGKTAGMLVCLPFM